MAWLFPVFVVQAEPYPLSMLTYTVVLAFITGATPCPAATTLGSENVVIDGRGDHKQFL